MHFHVKFFFFVLVNFTGIHKCLSRILHTSCTMNYIRVSVSFLLPPQNAPRQKERVKRHASYTQETALTQQDIYSCSCADEGRRGTFDCVCSVADHCRIVAAFFPLFDRVFKACVRWFIFSLTLDYHISASSILLTPVLSPSPKHLLLLWLCEKALLTWVPDWFISLL